MANITIVAPAIAREGITKQVANQIISLQQAGLQVSLIVLARSDVSILEEFGIDVDQFPILQLEQPTAYLAPGAFIWSYRLTRPVSRFLKAQQVQEVIAHAPYAHFVMRLVKLMYPKYTFVLVQYFHGLQYSEYPVNTWRRRLVNELNKWLAVRFDDCHISVSEVVKQEIIENLIRHQMHKVIYNNLPAQPAWNKRAEQAWGHVEQLLQQAADKFVMLLPNRIDLNKGQLFFLDVLNDFLNTDRVAANNIMVLIVGDGPQRSELEKQVEAKGLEQVIILTGALPNAVVQKLMREVQLVVVPSYKEGFSFAVLEALAAKCVVLASQTGGVREIIRPGETGFLFEPGNLQDCLNQLKYVYQNRNNYLINAKLVDLDLEEKFSNKKNTRKLLDALFVN